MKSLSQAQLWWRNGTLAKYVYSQYGRKSSALPLVAFLPSRSQMRKSRLISFALCSLVSLARDAILCCSMPEPLSMLETPYLPWLLESSSPDRRSIAVRQRGLLSGSVPLPIWCLCDPRRYCCCEARRAVGTKTASVPLSAPRPAAVPSYSLAILAYLARVAGPGHHCRGEKGFPFQGNHSRRL